MGKSNQELFPTGKKKRSELLALKREEISAHTLKAKEDQKPSFSWFKCLTRKQGLILSSCYAHDEYVGSDDDGDDALPQRRRFACITPKRYSDKNPPQGGFLFCSFPPE